MNIRAMIAEASLASGGKYQVFILLHVKDEGVPLFTGEDQPDATIRKHVPPEFHSITEVWNHAQLAMSLYLLARERMKLVLQSPTPGYRALDLATAHYRYDYLEGGGQGRRAKSGRLSGHTLHATMASQLARRATGQADGGASCPAWLYIAHTCLAYLLAAQHRQQLSYCNG